jgi:hypothetical protein
MGEYVNAQIEIGGALPRFLALEFIKSANSFIVENEEQALAEIQNHLNRNGCFYLDLDEISYGEFPDLESFCQENNLTYCRTRGGSYGLQAYRVYWDPSPLLRGGAEYTAMEIEGGPLVDMHQLKHAMDHYWDGPAINLVRVLQRLPCMREIKIPPLEIV